MVQITLEFLDQNTIRFQDAAALIGTKEAHKAFRRGLNHTGGKARTKVVRALSKQMGLPQKKIRPHLKTKRANFSALEYTISGTGSEIPLKEFGARQFSYGVEAKPWGKSRKFKGAFIFAGHRKSGTPVAGGHVFKRTTKASTPIEKMFGPSIPKEMIKDETAKEFNSATQQLSVRIAHEIRVISDGVIS